MAEQTLKGCRVAILVTDGFEQVELEKPRQALEAAGAETWVVAPKSGSVRGWNLTEWGDEIGVDMALDQADPNAFDALLQPGGVISPDKLRMDARAVAFEKSFLDAGKPVAAICHGPWMVIEAGAAKGRRMAAWPSLRTDVENAGAEYVDEPCVRSGRLVTSRKPDDIPQFNEGMIALFGEGRQPA